VAKRTAERCRPGERSWVTTKNRSYWRYGVEVETVRRSRQRAAGQHIPGQQLPKCSSAEESGAAGFAVAVADGRLCSQLS